MAARQRPASIGRLGKSSVLMHPIYTEYKDVVHYWMLQLLVVFGAHNDLIREFGITDPSPFNELDLAHLVSAIPFSRDELLKAIYAQHQLLLHKPIPKLPTKTQLAKNITWLSKVVGLNSIEQAILHFRVVASRHLALRACLEPLGKGVDLLSAAHWLSHFLALPESAIEQALSPSSTLIRAGLISVRPRLDTLLNKIVLLEGMADHLFSAHQNPYLIFKNNFTETGKPNLSKKDYPHLKNDMAVLTSYLRQAIDHKVRGVNVLIYGTPGSGKTEFVKMLAHEIGRPLYEIASEDIEGAPIKRKSRFHSFCLSQHILADGPNAAIILFDEVEDVFRNTYDDETERYNGSSGMKGWINKLLEGNPVPSFWLSNNLRCLDKAFVRRFDYVIELNTPPRSVRSKILDRYLDQVGVSQAWKSAMAEHEQLNPAVVERAAKVMLLAKQREPDLPSEKSLDRILGNTLEALELPRSPKNTTFPVTDYRLDVLNTDCNLVDICDGLRRHGAGRMCLFGPPGTGKTAFGRYLADTLDRPLIVRRASDILSMWLGGTEQNMARMFRDAVTENAILLLDEADTFLLDRSGATRSWEVSQVNEMLTQMELFDGIFIASTNLMGALDSASLRRFDLKVRFNYLRPDQAWKLFLDVATKFNLETNEVHESMLGQLHLLTPGDFANIVWQSRLRNITSAADLISLLKAECDVKPEGMKRKIGF